MNVISKQKADNLLRLPEKVKACNMQPRRPSSIGLVLFFILDTIQFLLHFLVRYGRFVFFVTASKAGGSSWAVWER